MRIACVGGGPAGLYFSILMKKAEPSFEVTLIERGRPADASGWGLVFSDATLENFQRADPESHRRIQDASQHWDDIDIFFRGTKVTSTGHGFCGIARRKLLGILQARAEALGVRLVYERELSDSAQLSGVDLIVAADGANSPIRARYAESFQPDIDVRKCRYIWLGTNKRLDAFTFAFEESQCGWFQLHAYRFDADTSALVVETREENWRAAGLEKAGTAASIGFCEGLFGKYLDGHPLIGEAGHWRGSWQNFRRIACKRWHHGNIVLIGDAARTAHFSVGSGAKLAMEDAIALTRVLCQGHAVQEALALYQQERESETLRLQGAARNRMEWFENVARYVHLDPIQFSYSLLTGSQRIGHESLRLRDREYIERVETWIAERSGAGGPAPVPPMFTPFRLRGLKLDNRVVMSPMAMYSSTDGMPDDFYLVHLGARALGGAGLIFTEMTCVAPQARISPGCAGLWSDEQLAAWKRIVDWVHQHCTAKIGLQLGHAGPKGSTQLGWENMDEPLPDGNWPLMAASALRYGPRNQLPCAMTRQDMDLVREQFVAAARRGAQAGFDMLELHCAHGYLMSSFICPLTNRRDDEYGGCIENRMRYPIEVFAAMRAVWPEQRPMSVRISAHDWAPGGNTPDDAVVIARLFKEAGADIIDVSSGQTTREAAPVYGRMYQTPFSDQIRNEVGIHTIAVGNIFEADHVNSIIAAGRADLCAIARAHLADPHWTLHAAAQLGYGGIQWPKQYLHGKAQLEHNLARAKQMAVDV
jgi:anthraniloyl-CoA monooxygenase